MLFFFWQNTVNGETIESLTPRRHMFRGLWPGAGIWYIYDTLQDSFMRIYKTWCLSYHISLMCWRNIQPIHSEYGRGPYLGWWFWFMSAATGMCPRAQKNILKCW